MKIALIGIIVLASLLSRASTNTVPVGKIRVQMYSDEWKERDWQAFGRTRSDSFVTKGPWEHIAIVCCYIDIEDWSYGLRGKDGRYDYVEITKYSINNGSTCYLLAEFHENDPPQRDPTEELYRLHGSFSDIIRAKGVDWMTTIQRIVVHIHKGLPAILDAHSHDIGDAYLKVIEVMATIVLYLTKVYIYICLLLGGFATVSAYIQILWLLFRITKSLMLDRMTLNIRIGRRVQQAPVQTPVATAA
jgi:hypothetical protein